MLSVHHLVSPSLEFYESGVIRSLNFILFSLRAWRSIEGFEGRELPGQIWVGPARGMLQAKKGDVGTRKTTRWVLSYQSPGTPGQKEENRPEPMKGS